MAKEREVEVSVVSGNAPESIAELQIKFGDLIARRGDLGVFSFVVGNNAFTDTKPPSRSVTWKHAFSGPFLSILWKGFSDASRPQAVLLPFRRGTKLVWCLDSLAKIIRRNSREKNEGFLILWSVCLMMRSE